jgi:phage host-nuclease inhibitor protein Gam
LNRGLTELKRELSDTNRSIGDLKLEVRALNTKIDTKFDTLDAKIDGVEKNLNTKIDALEAKMDTKFDAQKDSIVSLKNLMVGTMATVIGGLIVGYVLFFLNK